VAFFGEEDIMPHQVTTPTLPSPPPSRGRVWEGVKNGISYTMNLAACGGTFSTGLIRQKYGGLTGLTRFSYFPYILNIPGPDLACQDAVMESESFISSENSCISTSRRTRAGWFCRVGVHSSSEGILRLPK